MKKIFFIIITVISILLTSVYADGLTLSDAQKSDLYNLKIMVGDENGDLRLGDTITRAEAVKMICTAGNIPTYDEFESTFPDVAESHWAYKFICAAKANNIIDGDEYGNFNPEANITNEEIVKILVCLLGYQEMAETRSGYPAGYTTTASQFGITTGLQLAVNTPALRNDVGIMICNALDIPIMLERLSPEGNIEYVIMDGTAHTEKVTLRSNLFDKNPNER